MRATPTRLHHTRERLLDAAERLFAERGFSGTSVREITDAAVANLGAVNYHFRSKERLYAEVFTRRLALLRKAAVAAASSAVGRDRGSRLWAFGHAFLAPHEQHGVSARLLGLFARESVERRLPPGFLVRELQRPAIGALTDVMRQLRPGIRDALARACAHTFLAQLMYIVKGAGARVGSVDQQLQHAVRFTVAAVRHIEDASRRGARSRARS